MNSKFLFFLIIFSTFSFSQNSKNNLLKVEYNEYRIFTPKIINIDLGSLIVSNDFSYYGSSIVKKEKKGDSKDSESFGVTNIEDKLSEIIINRKTNILTERLDENIFLKKKYAVNENLPKMEWKLTKEQKKINTYLCKKATTVFRGRTYEVWYTEKIPISLGPWKFNGLPGLILSAEDKEGIYKWEAKTISYPYTKTKIDINSLIKENSKYKKVTFKEFDKLRTDAIKDKIQIVKARNSNRNDLNVGFEYSTDQEKEPTNEWRTQTYFK
ncbi:GLPGLI family protein [Flavobacterium gelidilacus]|uniref:GLPGLI family protein n=1 Tax=Flavobacterium gelidilacus TaxID=206041 RepID=UPI000415C1D0|nr:GLPGLI family protein [Flavobacterium gelidilacus]